MTVAPRRIPERSTWKPTQTRPGGVGGGSGPPVASKDSQCRDVREDPILQRARWGPGTARPPQAGWGRLVLSSFPAASSGIPLEGGSRLNVTQARPQATKSFKCDGEARTSAGPAIWARRGPASRKVRRRTHLPGEEASPPGPGPRAPAIGGCQCEQRPQRGLHGPAPTPGTRAPPPDPRAPDRTWARPAPGRAPPAVNAAPALRRFPQPRTGGRGGKARTKARPGLLPRGRLARRAHRARWPRRPHSPEDRPRRSRAPPAQNDERRRPPARALPAASGVDFRSRQAGAVRMCEELPAAPCAAILRTGLVGASRLGNAAKEACPVGAPVLFATSFSWSGILRESAGKLKGWGSEMVSLSATETWARHGISARCWDARVSQARLRQRASPFEGPLPSRRGDEPAQPIPSSSRGQRVAAVRP